VAKTKKRSKLQSEQILRTVTKINAAKLLGEPYKIIKDLLQKGFHIMKGIPYTAGKIFLINF